MCDSNSRYNFVSFTSFYWDFKSPLSLVCVSIRVSWPPTVGILFHPKTEFYEEFFNQILVFNTIPMNLTEISL